MTYPFQQQYPYQQRMPMPINQLRIMPVSNIMEANATPVEGFEPMFFYNRAENVIYMKKLNQFGAAPIQTFKLETSEQVLMNENDKKDINLYQNHFDSINEKLDGLYQLLKPVEVKKEKASKE